MESCISLRMVVVLMLNRWLALATDLSTVVAMVRHDGTGIEPQEDSNCYYVTRQSYSRSNCLRR